MTNQSPQPSGGPNCLTVMGILTLVVLVVMLVLGVLAWNAAGAKIEDIQNGFEELGSSIAGLPQSLVDSVEEVLKSETRATVEMERLVLASVQPLGQLVTVSNQYAEPNISVSVQDGFLGLCGSTVNHVVEGTIEAGLDLYQIEATDISHNEENDSWALQLPLTQLTSCRIDYIRQYERSFTLCRKDWDEYRLLAESVVLPKIRDEALEEGILSKAEEEARFTLVSFLRALTGSGNIRIEFRSGTSTNFPASCTRELPEGWKYDEESDSWLKEE